MMELVIKGLDCWGRTSEIVENHGLLIQTCFKEFMVLSCCNHVIMVFILSVWVLYNIRKAIWWLRWWPIFHLNVKSSEWKSQ